MAIRRAWQWVIGLAVFVSVIERAEFAWIDVGDLSFQTLVSVATVLFP